MTAYVSDLLYAARTLSRARAFTAVCVVSLGLGMGVVMALLLLIRMVFSTPPYVDRAHLAELVVRPSGQLLAQVGNAIVDTWSYPDYLDVRDAASTIAVTGWTRGEGLFQPAGQSETMALPTMFVSSNYFSTIGVTLPLGPGFTKVDDASRAEPEAVIGHRIWQTRFNSDPAIVGRTLTINQTSYVVVGVAPEKFRGHRGGLDDSTYALWLPLSRHPRLIANDGVRLARDTAWVQMLARLPEGTTARHADAIMQSAVAALATRHPSTTRDKTGGAEPYFPPGARLRSQISRARLMMVGLSGVVLLVVGLNISGMMLVRSAMRRRELAVRLALGASRWRLVRYHLSEALVMAILGGSLAAVLLFGGPIVVAWALDSWGPALDLFAPDPWLVLQCIALCLVTSLVLGALPALRFSRPAIVSALKSDSAGSGQRVGRLQRFTAAAQAGLAVPFLVICGLYLDQARVTTFADVGFTPKGLYAAQIGLPAITRTEEEQRLFIRTVVENLADAPGVASVSVGDGVPLDFIYRNARVAREGDGAFVTAHTTRVGPNYLDTIGTRLLAGRSIDASDREGSERVVLLSAPLARQLFPSGDPIGGRVTFALGGGERKVYTVVGVTGDLVSTQMGNPRPQMFLPLAQHPASTVLVIARAAPSAASAEASAPKDPSIRGAFHNAIAGALRLLPAGGDPDTAFRELITGESLIENSRSDILTMSAAGGVAASVALVLATFGVYGVIAFMVATRTREIGIRVALGASRGRVLRDVLASALTLVVPGIGVGLILSVLWVRLADPSWYPLGGVEPLVYTIAAATSFLVAVLAGIPSARRAAAVQPMVAMRAE
jgi:putative ABC transport system permease protein